MRKFVVSLILLVIVLVVVDRVAAAGAQNEIARQVQATYDLEEPPSVEIKGIPFLTQALSGKYEEIDIALGSLTRQGVELSDARATLHGVNAPLAQLIQYAAGTSITVDQVTGSVVIPLKALAARAPKGIRLTGGRGDTLAVSGNISVLGREVPATADMKIEVVKGAIRLTPVDVKLAGGIPVPNPEKLMTFTVPVKNLPLNLKITQVRTTPQGLTVEGTATHVRLK
ncbi:DUF2993 domain-containing protein [Microbispora sp. RL4-1S]|uniref:DUF2993 domain-containing protein n=1 Tax=Microbispora oryzae TaxID=2806554 RepID=A0A940WHM5_9ACTN|nr:DUF2993 domain-containing protein [Microbispora oryzae]MBP2705008.1 DUF2993 domain-containing protein [Microbispora oryzae]